jgi:hypothetical protein
MPVSSADEKQETTPVEPKSETPAPAKPKPARKPAAKKQTKKSAQPKAESNGSKKVGPVEVAEMIEKLVSKGSSVKDASEKIGEKLSRSPNSLAQTYYRVKREGSSPSKPKARGKAKPRKGGSLADALTEVSKSIKALAAEVKVVEKTAEKGSDAEAKLAEVVGKLKALR